MKCKLCNSNIEVPIISCDVCLEDNYFISSDIIDDLITQYSEYKNEIKQYEKDEHYDTNLTKAIKDERIKVLNGVVMSLEFLIEKYSNIDLDTIEESNSYVAKPKTCQMNSSKICNGCGDC